MYNRLLDEVHMTTWRSTTDLLHVEGWFHSTICGKYIYDEWRWQGLTSLRHIGRMSRNPKANRMCKRCANEYKDVNVDGNV